MDRMTQYLQTRGYNQATKRGKDAMREQAGLLADRHSCPETGMREGERHFHSQKVTDAVLSTASLR